MASEKKAHIFIIITMATYTYQNNRINSPFSEPSGQGMVRTLNNPSGLYE